MAFRKGESGNPAGRSPRVIEQARQSVLLDMFNVTAERKVVKAMIDKAATGDVGAATWIWDRVYGKVTDKVEQDNSGTMTIEIVYADRNTDDAPPP